MNIGEGCEFTQVEWEKCIKTAFVSKLLTEAVFVFSDGRVGTAHRAHADDGIAGKRKSNRTAVE